jgi:NRPS condensation-like uncharacterized protein
MKIPPRFRAHIIDQGMDILSVFFVPRIHMLIDFEGELDRDRLAKALRLCLDAEPVMGCRFVPRWIRPYWERLSKGDLDSGQLLQTGQDTDAFLSGDFDEKQGPQLRALLAPGERGERLVLKVNHQVADAGGVKELGYLLAGFYRKLRDDPGFRPEPNLGSRSLRQVYRRFLPRHFFGLLGRSIREQWGNLKPYKSMNLPAGTNASGVPVYVFKHFSKKRLEAQGSLLAEHNTTLNDIMVTAMLRALVAHSNWDAKSALRLTGTVDLRRYLPGRRGQAVCNLSSFFFVNLGYQLGSSFDETLLMVKKQIDKLKADHFGLGFIFGSYLNTLLYPYALARILMRKIFLRLQRSGNMSMGMTNMGSIDDHLLDFGAPRVSSAMLITPANQPPMLVSGFSGFRDSLSFSLGIHESSLARARVEELFETVDRELPGKEIS